MEQWGAVKHKKDKKQPTHRERERDGHANSSPRGQASPRGSARGRGSRGNSHHGSGGGSRSNRDRTTNGQSQPVSTSVNNASTWGATTTENTAGDGWNGPTVEPSTDNWGTSVQDSWGTDNNSNNKPQDTSNEVLKPNLNAENTSASPPSKVVRKVPASSGMSWAQIAK